MKNVSLVVFDFDGVMTDNRVRVHQSGEEAVWCHRGDGWGVARLREAGFQLLVLSTEANPVVAARCRKLQIQAVQGCDDKLAALDALAARHGITRDHVAYVGNDINDRSCLEAVRLPIVVADAHVDVLPLAKLRTETRGGYGAVREVCDLIAGHRSHR